MLLVELRRTPRTMETDATGTLGNFPDTVQRRPSNTGATASRPTGAEEGASATRGLSLIHI